MNTALATMVSIVTTLGLGGILGAYFQARFQHSTQISHQHEHDLKQKRYLCILTLMIARISPDFRLGTSAVRPLLKNERDIDGELTAELLNGYVFATDAVIAALSSFIRTPTSRTFVDTASAMRKDLWGQETSLNEEVLDLLSSAIAKQK